ncbi:MAG: STAS domain-containing protein [Planctomycetaceae bacterium]|nr:STAS domain-containing protein [Planctomycetaceae bacterium]MCA9112712.1 STAS domain-containing protein [Planctomycetaceae bacterium]
MIPESRRLQVYEAGKVTVVGFGGEEILDNINIAECRDDLLALVKDHGAEVIAFDLSGVRLIPSGLLGLMASFRKMNLKIQVYNPSPEIREVFSMTKFDQLIEIRELDDTTS